MDLVSARPIHLAIVEAVKTMTGGEGPWIGEELLGVAPGVIVAGLNPVTTDAVCMSVMGFDPMAVRGTPPFESCDSTLELAEGVASARAISRESKSSGLPSRRRDSISPPFAGNGGPRRGRAWV